LNLRFGLDLAAVLLVAIVAGSVGIIILSEVVKRMFKSDAPALVEHPVATVEAPSHLLESKRSFRISFGDRSYVIAVEELGETTLRAETVKRPQVVEPPTAAIREDTAEGVVKAPLPGVVLSIKCQPGDRVSVGSVLLTLEAMKMENEITAPAPGSVRRVMVREGQTVEQGQALVELGN
jgi:biotin carboxyl carrier protein